MRKLTTLIFALALVAAACGGGTSTEPADEAAATETAAPVTTTMAAMDEATTTMADMHDEDEGSHDDEGMHEEDEGTHDEDEGTHDEDIPADARVVEVVMTEFAFEPASVDVAAGETVVFKVKNEGAIEHEFRITNPHRIEEHVAAHDEGGHDETGGHHEDADVVLLIPAGDSDQVAVTFPEDTTIYTTIACLLPGHYEAGMHAEVQYGA